MVKGKEMDIYSPQGRVKREYLYVDDVVNAYITVGNHPTSLGGGVFNVGSGQVLSVYDLLKVVQSLGYDVRFRIVKSERGFKEIGDQWVNTSYLGQTLKWRSLTPIDEGLKKTIEWYRDYLS